MGHEATRQRHVETLLDRLPAHIDRLAWSADQLATWQADRLGQIVAHAIEHSPWHRDRLEPGAQLSSLPTMGKQDLIDHFDEIVTDPRLTQARVTEHLATLDAGDAYLFDEYHVVATGGSSGARTILVWDWEGWADCFLSLSRRNLVRPPVDSRPPVLAGVVGAHVSHMGAALMSTFSNPAIATHVVSATQPIDRIVDQLNTIQPTVLQGYPTMLRRVALEQRAGRLRIDPVQVLSTSETLTAETRDLLADVFEVEVANGYATSEAGGIASACGHGPWMHTNDDLSILEVENDRVLVTNLMNRVMPLIRYELDDLVVVDDVHCECGTSHRTVLDVRGRTSEIFRLGTVDVHPVVFSNALGAVGEVGDYQVRQRGDVIEVDVVAHGRLEVDALVARVERALADAGARVKVCLRTVAEIPRHPVTGKATRYLPDRAQRPPGEA